MRQELDLFLLATRVKHLDGLIERHSTPCDRSVLGDDFAHTGLDLRQFWRTERLSSPYLAEEAAKGQGVVYETLGLWEQFAHDGHQQEGEGAPVDAHAIGVGEKDGGSPGVGLYLVSQFAQFAVDQRGDERHRAVVQCHLDVLLQRRSNRGLKGATVGETHLGRLAGLGAPHRQSVLVFHRPARTATPVAQASPMPCSRTAPRSGRAR